MIAAIDWADEKLVAGAGALVAAVLVGWRVAKRVRVTMNGHEVVSPAPKREQQRQDNTDSLSSMDASLKTLVAGQTEALKRMDQIRDSAESVRRDLAELKGLVGRGG